MSKTNTTATSWRCGRRGAGGGSHRLKEGANADGKSCTKTKHKKINQEIKPPRFLNGFVNFSFLSSFPALCTNDMRSLPALEKIFISSYVYVIQTEGENEHSFSKYETQRKLRFRRKGKMGLGRIPTSQTLPSLPEKT